MGPARSTHRVRAGLSAAAGLACALLAGGCTLAPAKVWNLEQLHEPDGAPRRRGQLMGDLEYLAEKVLRSTNYGGAEFQQERAEGERIEDPFGECLENLIGLAETERDERVAALQVSAYAWLAVDCTYVLSRERCTLELGGLARDLGLPGAPPPPEGEPLAPEAVRAAFEQLLAAVRGVEAAPGLAGGSLAAECERLSGLVLDRPGALRLLRGTNKLLEGNEREALFVPLRALRLVLARRCTALALRAALEDPHGRVRAAALEAAVLAFPGERTALLRTAISGTMEGVEARDELSLRALTLLARHGLPPAEGEQAEAELAREFEDLVVQVLRLSIDGPHNTAACRAMARITGEPLTLRPEVWIARWRAERAARPRPATDPAAPAVPAQADGAAR